MVTVQRIFAENTESGNWNRRRRDEGEKMAMCKKNGDSADVCTANAAGKYNHCRRRVKSSSSKPSYSEPVRKLAKCKIKSLKSRKKKATLKWGKVKDAYWYEVCFSTKRNAGGKKRAVYGTSFTTPKLKKGKVYYFKVRAYGYPGNGSTSAYSAWSAVKKVRIK